MVNVVIPNGQYDEGGLNYFLTFYFNLSLDQCPISILSNLATRKFVIILKGNYKFRFTSDFCFILGFENEAKLTSKHNKGTKLCNITRNVDTIHIHFSLVDSSIVNGNTTFNVIWSLTPKIEPEMLLREIPIERQYLPINRNEYINA